MQNTVLITGCSSGFGLDAAKVFHARGWNVVATMRSPETQSELRTGERMLVTKLDVEDRASIDAAVALAISTFGGIGVVVNNAGFGLLGVFEETPRARLAEQFAVNLFGVMDVTRAVLPHLRRARAGVIINVSSGAGVFTLPAMSGYCASKFALEGFSESLSYELASVGITVKILEPGGVTTTRFVERSAAEAGRVEPIADYQPFREHIQQVFDGLRAARGRATSEEVAHAIFDAATDGTDRLRYVATADIVPLVEMRRQTSEAHYLGAMRKSFAFQNKMLDPK